MADTSLENPHVRASKTATYFASTGVLSWGLTALAIVIHAPISVPGLLLIGGGIAMGATEKGRNFAKKLGNQLVDLGNDLMSHLSEDVGRLGKWWHRVTAPKTPATVATPAPVAAPAASAPAFNAPAQAPGFNQAAKTAEVGAAPAPAPQLVPPAAAPKAP